jgi:hexosaminidase
MQNIIPHPASIAPEKGTFNLTANTTIRVQPGNEEVSQIAQMLAEQLRPPTGYPLLIIDADEKDAHGGIVLSLAEGDPALGDEGYELRVRPEGIWLTASHPAGLFHGIQSIRQLLPAAIEKRMPQKGPWTINAMTIRDRPRFGWRGTMLDVARHFFGPAVIKRFIDQLACYKFNILHLHLTDDQGWRLMIDAWPKLAEFGGKYSVNRDPGGYYTQEEYRDIVEYARQRYITIVPEVDMPGHTNAALASYAELNPSGRAAEMYTATGVGFSTFAIHHEFTYKLLQDVISEVIRLTPGPYFHIGGDEAHSTPDADYSFFVKRIQDMVWEHGKICVGWEEVAKAELLPNTIVQFWWNRVWARKGAEQGRKFIMSPASHAYMDIKYNESTTLGQDWTKKYIEVQDAYQWDPSTVLEGVPESTILGIEAPLWTETIVTTNDLDYMLYPRLLGYSEIGWSRLKSRNWSDYRLRLGAHGPRLAAMGIKFYLSPQISWE